MDPLGRVVSVTRALGEPEEATLERNTYDGVGNKETQTDAEGRVTRFVYDAANRLASRTDGFGTDDAATTTFVYDKVGNTLEERDARAAALGEPWSVKRTWDELNRLETETDGEGNVTTYGYDPEGNRTSVQTPKGPTTTTTYDELGKPLDVTQPPPNAGRAEPRHALPLRREPKPRPDGGRGRPRHEARLRRAQPALQDDARSRRPRTSSPTTTDFDEDGHP